MKRIQLFEFEDFNWLPDTIRTSLTNLIVVLHRLLGTADVITSLIQKVRSNHEFSQVVDLGSGSGGAMLEVAEQLNEEEKDVVDFLLTDLHPNADLVQKINARQLPNLHYLKTSVNATDFEQTPEGLKTMVNSFHHMPPETAKKILKSAQDNREAILIYEIGENFVPTILWWLLLPLSLVILIIMSLVMTLFVRPLTFKQLFFTYLIPIVPLIYAWDGQASTMRTYTFDDIKFLIQDFENESYHWEIEKALKPNGKALGYYIMGYPK